MRVDHVRAAPVSAARAPRAQRAPLLPREMALLAIALPPVLYLLLDPEALSADSGAALRSFASITLYTLLCAGTTHALFELVLPPLETRLPAPVRVIVYGAALAAAVGGATLLFLPVLADVCPDMAASPRLAVQGVIISWIYAGFGVFSRLARERLAEARARQLAERASALEARLRALTARTQPHFLFNSLNAAMSLVAEDPARAEVLLARLSSLYRYALDGSSRGLVDLGEELAATRDYLEIEQTRFGDRIAFEIDAPASVQALRVPPMLLQPLAENAVLHGVAPRVAGGRVELRARVDGEALELVVSDRGNGPLRASPHRGSGTALADLRERLAIVYGERATLETRSDDDGFVATLRLPLG